MIPELFDWLPLLTKIAVQSPLCASHPYVRRIRDSFLPVFGERSIEYDAAFNYQNLFLDTTLYDEAVENTIKGLSDANKIKIIEELRKRLDLPEEFYWDDRVRYVLVHTRADLAQTVPGEPLWNPPVLADDYGLRFNALTESLQNDDNVLFAFVSRGGNFDRDTVKQLLIRDQRYARPTSHLRLLWKFQENSQLSVDVFNYLVNLAYLKFDYDITDEFILEKIEEQIRNKTLIYPQHRASLFSMFENTNAFFARLAARRQ
jgi:hypothetical protein